MSVDSIASYLYKVNEFWARNGAPVEMFTEAGAFAKMIRKDLKATWGGDEVAKLPVDYVLGGNAGASYAQAVTFAAGDTGAQFQVPLAELWAIMKLDWKFLELTKQPGFLRDNATGEARKQARKMRLWMKALSYTLWGDGSGKIAKGDGSYSVGGSTITLLNRRCAKRFDKGDVIQLIDASTGTVRPGTLTLSANPKREAGQLTTSANVNTIVGAVNTDYIAKAVDVAAASSIMQGVFAWCPIKHATAITSFNGVTRSDDPEALAGWRIPLSGSETPWQVCNLIAEVATEYGIPIDKILIPNHEWKTFENEYKAHYTDIRTGKTATSRSRFTMGVSGFVHEFPELGEVMITSDVFLNDIDAGSDEEDRLYVATRESDWGIITTPSGVGWVDQTGNGKLQQIAGSQTVLGSFGCFGNLKTDAPGHTIIASPRATNS